jgi:TolA-binding protein
MRLTRYTPFAAIVCTMLLAPGPAPAASGKETPMQDLQRDVAQLSDQLKELQKSADAKFAALQAQLQQALDTANKTNASVGTMSTGVTQTIQSELKAVRDQLGSVIGLSVKVDSAANDVADLKSGVQSLQVTVNKQQQLLSDILNQLRLVQAPAAAPPAAVAAPPDAGAAASPAAAAPPPLASALFKKGVDDWNAGKTDLALQEFTEFLRLYPTDDNGRAVHYNIGEIHYGQGKLEEAVKDFDAAIEQYSEDATLTPEACYMKGMALYKQKKPAAVAEAAKTFHSLIAKYPRTDEAEKAKKQLTAMGLSGPPAKSRK